MKKECADEISHKATRSTPTCPSVCPAVSVTARAQGCGMCPVSTTATGPPMRWDSTKYEAEGGGAFTNGWRLRVACSRPAPGLFSRGADERVPDDALHGRVDGGRPPSRGSPEGWEGGGGGRPHGRGASSGQPTVCGA